MTDEQRKALKDCCEKHNIGTLDRLRLIREECEDIIRTFDHRTDEQEEILKHLSRVILLL